MENILTEINALRNKKTPEEIEDLILDGEFGKVVIGLDSYQFIRDFRLSWLVVEAHESGFIEWMRKHPNEYVVHHKDGNKLNNIFTNLQVMSRNSHLSLHRTDPKFAGTEKARKEKFSKAISAYYADPANAKDIEDRGKAISDTKIAKRNWIDLERLKKLFTVKEYAKANNIRFGTAWLRLSILLKDGKVVCEKKLVDRKWYNIYSIVGALN